MTPFVRRLPFGATCLDGGLTAFRLWAPAQRAVTLEIDGGQTLPMREKDGWFEVEANCGPGAQYRYRLGSGLVVPDPAARAQAAGVHGPSLVVDPLAYRWRCPEWQGRPWRETVLYELHAGLFGGFRGVEQALPRLAGLGVTAVELMPVNAFPGTRNWGYDGVLPFAPATAYGTPVELKSLIDTAHGLGLMVFLDVVYNHFGPDGNYLAAYAPQFFRADLATPWGDAIDFRRPEVRRFFTENALYWLMEYRFDGLRFDAVHAIGEADWLDEMAAEVRATAEPGRQVHLVLEHDGNAAGHLARDFDAQWNDDGHHVLHVLLTGENEGYYRDYADRPAERLARCLAEGFIYQGEPSAHRGGKARGTPSAGLPPTAFVLFLQNHDQVGNRAFGERLTTLVRGDALEAAIALQLLCPQIPLLFMGEEGASRTPFFYFTDHSGDLAGAVREGRRQEFATFKSFADPERRAEIPDPNDPETFARSLPLLDDEQGLERTAYYHTLLALRRRALVPRLDGTRTRDAAAIGPAAVLASWILGDGALLTLAVNLGGAPVAMDGGRGDMLFESRSGAGEAARGGELPGFTTVAFLEAPR